MEATRGEPPSDPALEEQFRLWQSALTDHGHALPGGEPVAEATPLPPEPVREPVLSAAPPSEPVHEPVLPARVPTDPPPAMNERKNRRRRRWPAAVFVGALLLAILAGGYREFNARLAPINRPAAAHPPAAPMLARTPPPDRTPPPPDDPDRSRIELADNIAHAGEALALSGDTAGALRLYQQSLSIRRELAARHPDDAAAQRALAGGWDKVADAFAAQGDTDRAPGAYREAAAAWERCARLLPEDRDVQRNGSLTALSLGNLLLACNDPAGAVEALRRGTSIQETLCRLEPDNAAWQEDLALGWLRLSDAFDQQEDDAGALQACRRALAIDEALVTREPANLAWQGDLATAHGKAGDLLLAGNEIDAALQEYEEAASGWEELVAGGANPERRRALAETKDRIGQAQEANKQPAAALPFYEQALRIAAGLSAESPADPLLGSLHAVVCYHLGRALTHCQPVDQKAARAALHEARDRLTDLKSADGTYACSEQAEILADVQRLLAELGKWRAIKSGGNSLVGKSTGHKAVSKARSGPR